MFLSTALSAPIATDFDSSVLTIDTSPVQSIPSGLVETEALNFFTSLSPAAELLVPIFPQSENFNVGNSLNSFDVEVLAAPILSRLSITTRKPNTPHHLESDADLIVRSEFENGYHKITSARQSYEFKQSTPKTASITSVIPNSGFLTYGLPVHSQPIFSNELLSLTSPSTVTLPEQMAQNTETEEDREIFPRPAIFAPQLPFEVVSNINPTSDNVQILDTTNSIPSNAQALPFHDENILSLPISETAKWIISV